MIQTFSHKGLEKLYRTGKKSGIAPSDAVRLGDILAILNSAAVAGDMNFPGARLHALKGDKSGHHAVNVSGSWRVTFRFEQGDAYEVDYRQYH